MTIGDESIYNMVRMPQEPAVRPKMYRSRYSGTQAPAASTFKMSLAPKNGTMGSALGTAKPDPAKFLKRGTSKNQSASSNQRPFMRATKGQKKPGIPSRKERPVMGLQSTKNYVTANAVEAILAVPGNKARIADQPPRYKNKADYGKVPAYLDDVKQEIAREEEMIKQYMDQQWNGNNEWDNGDDDDEEEISGEEAIQLLHALKEKWGVVNKRYQLQCHSTKLDTIGKVRRKERDEKELQELETDIELMQKMVDRAQQ